jgi:hypothetical protein
VPVLERHIDLVHRRRIGENIQNGKLMPTPFAQLEDGTMMFDSKAMEVVGRYAGAPGIICAIYAGTIEVLVKLSKASNPENTEKRFHRLSAGSTIVAVLAIAAWTATHVKISRQSGLTITNTTNGLMSPIVPDNSGTVNLTCGGK